MYKTDHRLQTIADDTIIWRYMNFTSFYDLLLNRSLFFRRLDKYTDELEGTLPEQTKDGLYKYRLAKDFTTQREAKEWTNRELLNIETYKAHILSNSWTMNDHENYAMWKIYLNGYNEGMAIKSTVGKLTDCLSDTPDNLGFYSGAVKYEPFSYNDIDMFSVSTNKREAYRYEKEYRALLFQQYTINVVEGKNIRIPNFALGTSVKINIDTLIDELYISPFGGSWFKGIAEAVITQFLPDFDKTKIKDSGIKDR